MMSFFKVISAISSAIVIAIPDILDTGIQLYNIERINQLENIGIFSKTQDKNINGKLKFTVGIHLQLKVRFLSTTSEMFLIVILFLLKIRIVLRFKLVHLLSLQNLQDLCKFPSTKLF